METKKIKTQLQHTNPSSPVRLGGWFQGKRTYLWFGESGRCLGLLSGHALYRLAKAIVRHYESEAANG